MKDIAIYLDNEEQERYPAFIFYQEGGMFFSSLIGLHVYLTDSIPEIAPVYIPLITVATKPLQINVAFRRQKALHIHSLFIGMGGRKLPSFYHEKNIVPISFGSNDG